jgi:hypothetical protein
VIIIPLSDQDSNSWNKFDFSIEKQLYITNKIINNETNIKEKTYVIASDIGASLALLLKNSNINGFFLINPFVKWNDKLRDQLNHVSGDNLIGSLLYKLSSYIPIHIYYHIPNIYLTNLDSSLSLSYDNDDLPKNKSKNKKKCKTCKIKNKINNYDTSNSKDNNDDNDNEHDMNRHDDSSYNDSNELRSNTVQNVDYISVGSFFEIQKLCGIFDDKRINNKKVNVFVTKNTISCGDGIYDVFKGSIRDFSNFDDVISEIFEKNKNTTTSNKTKNDFDQDFQPQRQSSLASKFNYTIATSGKNNTQNIPFPHNQNFNHVSYNPNSQSMNNQFPYQKNKNIHRFQNAIPPSSKLMDEHSYRMKIFNMIQ